MVGNGKQNITPVPNRGIILTSRPRVYLSGRRGKLREKPLEERPAVCENR